MAAAFGPLMTRVLLRVPVDLAADATGVVVTVNQVGLLVGAAAFGTLYLNLTGRLPGSAAPSALAAFRPVSAHAEAITFGALAAVGVLLALAHVLERRTPQSLNPSPSSLNPSPQSLNPSPQSLTHDRGQKWAHIARYWPRS
jgi:hypothetical protein